MKKGENKQITVQRTTGEQLTFIFTYKSCAKDIEEHLLKKILATRMEETKE